MLVLNSLVTEVKAVRFRLELHNVAQRLLPVWVCHNCANRRNSIRVAFLNPFGGTPS